MSQETISQFFPNGQGRSRRETDNECTDEENESQNTMVGDDISQRPLDDDEEGIFSLSPREIRKRRKEEKKQEKKKKEEDEKIKKKREEEERNKTKVNENKKEQNCSFSQGTV